jgi:hypothetical protein
MGTGPQHFLTVGALPLPEGRAVLRPVANVTFVNFAGLLALADRLTEDAPRTR